MFFAGGVGDAGLFYGGERGGGQLPGRWKFMGTGARKDGHESLSGSLGLKEEAKTVQKVAVLTEAWTGLKDRKF